MAATPLSWGQKVLLGLLFLMQIRNKQIACLEKRFSQFLLLKCTKFLWIWLQKGLDPDQNNLFCFKFMGIQNIVCLFQIYIKTSYNGTGTVNLTTAPLFWPPFHNFTKSFSEHKEHKEEQKKNYFWKQTSNPNPNPKYNLRYPVQWFTIVPLRTRRS